MKDAHAAGVAAALVMEAPAGSVGLVASALETWRAEQRNASQEFWQQFFEERPALLLAVLPDTAFVLRRKCYVGGKQIANVGGNVVDFLAQGRGNVTLIEIKPPTERLVGKRYRWNGRSPCPALPRACLQILVYKSSLLNNVSALARDA